MSFVSESDQQSMKTDKKKALPQKPKDILNAQKQQVLQQYSIVFFNINLDEITVLPILQSRREVLRTIELIYDQQVKHIATTKTKHHIYISAETNKYFKKKFKDSQKQFIQNLFDFIYSIHKLQDFPEIKLFISFLQSQRENLQVLFYLYIRQFIKIQEGINFLQLHSKKKSPLQLSFRYINAENALIESLWDDKITQRKVLKNFHIKFENKKVLNYYNFLVSVAGFSINYKDLDLMENLIALYSIKSKNALMKVKFSEYASRYSKMEQYQQYTPEQSFQQEQKPRTPQNEPEVSSDKQFFRNDEEDDEDCESINNQVPQPVHGNPLDQQMFIDMEAEQIYHHIKNKQRKKTPKKDVTLQLSILGEIEAYCHKILSSYVKQNEILIENLPQVQTELKVQIKKKLLFLCICLFFNERKSFFSLLRTDVESDPETLEYWDSLCEIYDQLKQFDSVDRTIAKTFLHKLFEYELLAEQMLQYIKFNLQNDMDLVNYKVDFEFDENIQFINQNLFINFLQCQNQTLKKASKISLKITLLQERLK